MMKLHARYNPEELRLILDYLERSTQILANLTERLRRS
jgi:hypothetical protein